MTAASVLDRLRSHGVRLRLAGDRVRLVAPQAPPPDLVEEARAHRAELVELLRREADGCEPLRRRLADVIAVGHHERRWVRGARVPEAMACRLQAGAIAVSEALRQEIADHEQAGGCSICRPRPS